MSTDEKKKNDDEMMDALVRKPGRPPKVDSQPNNPPIDPGQNPAKVTDLGGVAGDPQPLVENAELAQLREDNAMLMKLVMEMKAKLMPDSAEKEAAQASDFQKKKAFSKVRGMEVGVYYIQNGRKYNGKFELIPDKV